MPEQNNEGTVREDTEAHERLGFRVDDKNNDHVDLEENGAIEGTDHQEVWT